MFICKPCLLENYYNFGQFTSFGICEQCGKHSYCHDIPSGNLNPRPVTITLEDLGLKQPAPGMKIVGLDEYLEKERIRMENLKPAEWAKENVINSMITGTPVAKSFDITSIHKNHIKNKPMISNEDHSTEKSPWRWLWHGDKSWFVPAFFVFTCIATWVSWEYEWQVAAITLLVFGSITLGLVIYRVQDYNARVSSMEILSFPDWKKFKKSH